MPALNLGTVETTTSSLTNTIKTYYDRMLLEVLDPQTKFYQFATLKPLPVGEGTSVDRVPQIADEKFLLITWELLCDSIQQYTMTLWKALRQSEASILISI